MELTAQALVIGGGAVGCCLARDLARRGVSVCLLERGDLAAGTTGHYHGLLHSGARYVTDDPAVARECAAENAILRRIAPHCIEDTGGLYLVLDARAELLFQPAFLAGCREAGIPYEELDHRAVLRAEPLVAPNVRRAFRVRDAVLDAWRFCVANVLDAQDHGAWAFRGVAVDTLIREGDRIAGATGRNSITLQPYTVHAECVVNATGAWAGRVAALAGVEVPLTPNKGVLVALARRPVTHVLHNCRPPADGDIVVPDGTRVVVGTTATPAAGPDDTAVPEGAPAALVDEAIRLTPVLREIEVAHSWAAVRPLAPAAAPASSAAPDSRALSRDYALLDHESRDALGGFVTIVGGKVTTARLMAAATADLVCAKLGVAAPCRTADEALPGAEAGVG
ncbi:MAG TPA: FAD-dependent oxidoreductase [Thermomicrobiales bacterium]|nr:FAD-dependent oxidoreductase [Thermomicrobiales bacterium]